MTRFRLVVNATTGVSETVAFSAEEEAAADAADAAAVSAANDPANVPLSMRQLRLGLKELGGKSASFLLDTINAIPDADERDRALIWYEETTVVHWDHPMTQKLIKASGFTTEEATAMWLASPAIDAA